MLPRSLWSLCSFILGATSLPWNLNQDSVIQQRGLPLFTVPAVDCYLKRIPEKDRPTYEFNIHNLIKSTEDEWGSKLQNVLRECQNPRERNQGTLTVATDPSTGGKYWTLDGQVGERYGDTTTPDKCLDTLMGEIWKKIYPNSKDMKSECKIVDDEDYESRTARYKSNPGPSRTSSVPAPRIIPALVRSSSILQSPPQSPHHERDLPNTPPPPTPSK